MSGNQVRRKPKKGELLVLRIEKLVFGGKGMARYTGPQDGNQDAPQDGSPDSGSAQAQVPPSEAEDGGFVIFVPHSAPGDLVRVRVYQRKRYYAEAKILELLEPSPLRQTARCAHFGECGGCTWQFLAYEDQLAEKERQLHEIVQRQVELTNLPNDFYRPVVPAPEPYHYRNKLDYSFGFDLDEEGAVGFHRRGDFRHVVGVENCHIHPESFDALLAAVRDWMAEFRDEIPPYNKKRHEGVLRSLIIRHSVASNESLAIFLTNSRDPLPGGGAEGVGLRLQKALPGLVGVLHGHNGLPADFSQIEEVVDQWGAESIEEKLGAVRFGVSPFSFFQTNTEAAKRLYDIVYREGKFGPDSVLFDAYCGTGSIGIYCAAKAREEFGRSNGESENEFHLFGIEIVEDAVVDAYKNATRNNLEGEAHFFAGDIRAALPELREALGDRDLTHLIIDPPRGGMHKKALRELLELQVPRLIYVSCNPTTLARDAEKIIEAGYRAESLTPVDLFPQTYHIEAVMTFQLG